MRYILRVSFAAEDFYGRVTAEDGTREWDVEADWTAAQVRRWIAAGYPGGGPGRFGAENDVITTAAGRFTGTTETRGWEDQVTAGEPGDQLYLSYVAGDSQPVNGRHGTVIAEIPGPPPPEPEPEPEPPAVAGPPAAALTGTGTLTAAAAPYDQGGSLPPGLAEVQNTASRDEPALPGPEPGSNAEGGGDAR
jgi:hypothetical protein